MSYALPGCLDLNFTEIGNILLDKANFYTFVAQFVKMVKNYETIFVLDASLSTIQTKDAIDKFVSILTDAKTEIIGLEQWGIKQMAYPIQKKTTGFYNLVEFKADTSLIKTFETELKRDESVIRFLTVALDKHAIEYNRRRRNGEFNKKKNKSTTKENVTV